MDSTVTQLKVDDEEFLVASLIDRCPKTMMLRELVQNALEAAVLAPAGQRRVEIDAITIDGGKKLRIKNTGPGMDESSLYAMCDLASSIGKLKGLDKNFGMGAKVASLPSNHLGVRYRSCTRKRVHELVIGKRNGIYGRVLRPKRRASTAPGSDRMYDIFEVTDQAREEGIDLSFDWTEVVLLGMRANQDTALDPYDGDPASASYWLPDYLYHRYFRMPDGMEVTISPDYHWRQDVTNFRTLAQRAERDFAKYECVTTNDGLRVHYFYDPTCAARPWENESSEGAIQTAIGQVALVYRDEIYERKFGSQWAYDAPLYGITFGARNTSVFIELPDSYPIHPDSYRQFLMNATGEQSQLTTRDFASQVRVSRPEWLLTAINELGGQFAGSNSVIKDLGSLGRRLNLQALAGDGGVPPSNVDGTRSEAQNELGFDIIVLHNEQDINDRWLRGRAACFYPETMQLFVNTHYPSVQAMQFALMECLPSLREAPDFDQVAKDVATECLVTRVGRALLFGISKHLNKDDWFPGHVEKAMSPEALSIAADDYEASMPWAAQEVTKRQGPRFE